MLRKTIFMFNYNLIYQYMHCRLSSAVGTLLAIGRTQSTEQNSQKHIHNFTRALSCSLCLSGIINKQTTQYQFIRTI